MLGGVGESPLQVGRPRGGGLIGQAVDHVQAELVEPGRTGVRDGALGLRGRVDPSEQLQVGGVEGLHADGQPVHARRPKPFEPVPVDRPGVGLERDLHRRFEAEPGRQQREDRLDFPRLERRGGPAADVDRVEDQPARRRRRDFRAQRRQEGRLQAEVGDRVEIAVGALAHAERDVDVDAGEGEIIGVGVRWVYRSWFEVCCVIRAS